jgi:hypothetical protein
MRWMFWDNFYVYFGSKDVRSIKCSLALLELKGDEIMATLAEVKASIAAEAAEVTKKVNDLADEIQALKDALAAGTLVTAADLDDLKASVEGIFTPPVIP